MAYANDVVIMGKKLQEVEKVLTSQVEKTNKMVLETNVKKTKFMTVSRMPYNENKCVKLGKYNSEIANDYTYLATIQTNKNELRPNNEKIITNAIRAYYALLPLLKRQSVLRAKIKNRKIKICKTSGNIFICVVLRIVCV
jgi:hypothetical protein